MGGFLLATHEPGAVPAQTPKRLPWNMRSFKHLLARRQLKRNAVGHLM